MDIIRDIWEDIKETVRKEYDLSEISYNTWIAPLKFYKMENDTVIISIPSDQSHALKYISSRYKSFFQVTISEMFEDTYEVKFILESDVSDIEERPVDTANILMDIAFDKELMDMIEAYKKLLEGGKN